MPKIVTRQTRILETRDSLAQLRAAENYAMAVETDADATEADKAAKWAEVATLAGAVQRRTRQLAGLGRGG